MLLSQEDYMDSLCKFASLHRRNVTVADLISCQTTMSIERNQDKTVTEWMSSAMILLHLFGFYENS